MDRAVLQKVSERWNEYGFKGASPVADMIPRLTRPEVKKGRRQVRRAGAARLSRYRTQRRGRQRA